ncbi:nif11-like leader peptide domain protein [Synechococcus sp. BIOS-U3-1]|uniref:Nif11-like leader peptide family natural product precursor n=1 Tax=Synechococcus sp. BIOS-U3-1 TaxID=1400865 RepID=UPI001861A844|nr:nif11-like leader peptide domain protein [Synechococcus sp. BIOS-U3-1]|tara:strand:- start:6393 stop:6692 length:300 start_codon:yes stop_codon:yes gene_type:complete
MSSNGLVEWGCDHCTLLFMSLQDLDTLLQQRRDEQELAQRLSEPVSVETLIELGRERGLTITEDDVFSAQLREDSDVPSAELQKRMADESRRLRHFIQG